MCMDVLDVCVCMHEVCSLNLFLFFPPLSLFLPPPLLVLSFPYLVPEVEWDGGGTRQSGGGGGGDAVKHLTSHSWGKLGDGGKERKRVQPLGKT